MIIRPLSDEILMGNGGLVWTKFEQAFGYRALSGLCLALEAEVFSADRLGAASLDLRATLSMDQSPAGWFRLGTAFAKTPLHLPPSGSEHRQRRVSLELVIDPVTLAAIEVQRDGGDLRLQLDWVAIANTVDGAGLAGSHGEHWTVPGEQWVTRVLAQAQTHRAVSVITPAPGSDSTEEYRRADKQLTSAVQALRTGRYDDAVMAVRKGIDALGVRTLQAPKSTDRNDRTVDERYGALADALHHLASVSAHPDGANVDYQCTREDAVAAVAGLTALMQRLPETATPAV